MCFWPHDPYYKATAERNIPVTSKIYLDDSEVPATMEDVEMLWLETPSGEILKTLPGHTNHSPKSIAQKASIELKLDGSKHEYVDDMDFWWNPDNTLPRFPSFRHLAYYFKACEDAGRWVGTNTLPKDFFTPKWDWIMDVFLPTSEEEINAVNKWSFMAHYGFFHDCPDSEHEKAVELGIIDHFTKRRVTELMAVSEQSNYRDDRVEHTVVHTE